MHMPMHSTFYWGPEVTILFQPWMVMTWTQYEVALVAVFCFCVLHEWFTTFRSRAEHVLRSTPLSSSLSEGLLEREGSSEEHGHRRPSRGARKLSVPTGWWRLVGSLLYGVNSASSYLIMLIVMTFNGGLFLAVVTGLSTGYFLFGWERGKGESSC